MVVVVTVVTVSDVLETVSAQYTIGIVVVSATVVVIWVVGMVVVEIAELVEVAV